MVRHDLSIQTLHIGDEGNQILVVDEFLRSPDQVSGLVRESSFVPAPGFHERKGYPGVRARLQPQVMEPCIVAINDIIETHFSISPSASRISCSAFLSMMTVPESDLGPYQLIPHFDTSKSDYYAALVYLCGEEHGGTAFYRHNSTRYESILSHRSERYLDVCHSEMNTYKREQRYFSETDDFYTKIAFVPAKVNRLIIYKGCLLHSANIKSSKSLNADPRIGRLTLNLFCNFE